MYSPASNGVRESESLSPLRLVMVFSPLEMSLRSTFGNLALLGPILMISAVPHLAQFQTWPLRNIFMFLLTYTNRTTSTTKPTSRKQIIAY